LFDGILLLNLVSFVNKWKIIQMKIAFYTFGCRLNQAETAIMQQSFDGNAVRVVDWKDQPDVLVVNTCTVTENGDADTRKLVNKVRKINPDIQIALVGCQAQVQKEKLLTLPNVKWVVGNEKKMDIADIVTSTINESVPQLITPTIQRKSFTIPFVGFDHLHTRANLKIQDGCDFFCGFCEIPYARGRARSREFDDLLNEARHLAESGHHELILTGINIGTYAYEGKTLVDVIKALSEIEALWRIRISSIEPTTIAEEIVQQLAEPGKLCRYLHIPIQSGSDDILKAMNRKYNVAEFVEFIDFAYRTNPNTCLGTDVIVGYPGESDKHFRETYDLLLELPFAYFHVFSYSDRDHARSSKLPEHEKISRETIIERSRKLRELSQRKRMVYNEQFLGTTEGVLFEKFKNGYWNGVTDTYIRVRVKSELDLKNRLLPVKLEKLDKQGIVGTLV
jgi:threonylcarbamoyladenosine tRNA methylthiotransferase MtaB